MVRIIVLFDSMSKAVFAFDNVIERGINERVNAILRLNL